MTSVDGLLVVDKPEGVTSREAVDRVQRWFPRRTRVGHTGTLDPLATGVLVICIGTATRLVEYVQNMAKTYRSIVLLGETSDTDDREGIITPVEDAEIPGQDQIECSLASFVGTIEQVPPIFSAAKIDGRRAHEIARRGKPVEISARTVTIYRISLLRYQFPELEIEVHCGKGTYLRSLARDLGRRLGCGGFVKTLRRTRVGPFPIESAISLIEKPVSPIKHLLPLKAAVSDLPKLVLPTFDIEALCHGRRVRLPESSQELRGQIAVYDASGDVVAVAEVLPTNGEIRPIKVLS